VRAGTDQRKPQVVGEEADCIQEASLLSEGACEQRVNLINDKQSNFKLSGERSDAVA
jgi:hypothetical protein